MPHYPLGRLNESDQGELSVEIAGLPMAVLLRFAAPIRWIGLDRELASRVIALLRTHAAAIIDQAGAPSAMSSPVIVYCERGVVILKFPKAIKMLGLSRTGAIALADSIQEAAWVS